jgi:tyrosyl-tRNA synthetase
MPSTAVKSADLEEGIFLLDVLLSAGLVASKGEGKRLIQQKGIYLNDNVIEDPFYMLKKKISTPMKRFPGKARKSITR